MDSIDLRQSVLDYIKNKADNKFLRLVNAMATTYQEVDESMTQTTLETYNIDIEDAIKEIENGEFYSQEEVEKITKKW